MSAIFGKFRGRFTTQSASVIHPDDVVISEEGAAGKPKSSPHHHDKEKEAAESHENTESDSDTLSLEERNEREVQRNPNNVTADAQMGQQKIEAIALVWPKWAVYATYGWIWVCFFMLALQQGTVFQLNAAAYANFQSAPEVVTASVLATIIGGVLKLPIAKILNIWGRAEGYLVFVGIYLLGMIVLASSSGPNSYAAGYTLYWIGYLAIFLILDVFVADTSGLRNRAFALAFVQTPFICTAFTSPLVAARFILFHGWRWGYGTFIIVQFVVLVPLGLVFKFYQRKAESVGVYKRPKSGRTVVQSLIHYFHEFDIIGCLLLMAAFLLFLLPLNLNTSGRASYGSATFIVMVVVGICLFPVFAIWEKYFARVQFVRWELFKQRTVLGACGLSAILFFSFYLWDLNFYNFNVVVHDLSLSDAGYMGQIYNVGSTFWAVVFGIYVRITKHFKYAALFFGAPLMLLGSGLMIHFRSNNQPIGYVVMSQIFIAFAGGTLVISEDMAAMAAADRDGIPMLLSLLGLFTSIGGAVGYAVAGAIYQNVFPDALARTIPTDFNDQVELLYLGGYIAQLRYPAGTPVRNAVDYAWGETQKYGSIASTAILILTFPCIALWKNYNVDKKQNKGTVL